MHQEVLKTRPFHTTLRNFQTEFIDLLINQTEYNYCLIEGVFDNTAGHD